MRMGGPGFDLFEPNNNYVKVYNTKTKFGVGDFRRMSIKTSPAPNSIRSLVRSIARMPGKSSRGAT